MSKCFLLLRKSELFFRLSHKIRSITRASKYFGNILADTYLSHNSFWMHCICPASSRDDSAFEVCKSVIKLILQKTTWFSFAIENEKSLELGGNVLTTRIGDETQWRPSRTRGKGETWRKTRIKRVFHRMWNTRLKWWWNRKFNDSRKIQRSYA